MGFKKCLLDNGLNDVGSNRMVDDFGGPVEVYLINKVDEVTNSSLVNQRVGGICRKPKMVEFSVGKGRKYKGMIELAYDENEIGVDDSNTSLSDRDIEHRNSVILKVIIATLR